MKKVVDLVDLFRLPSHTYAQARHTPRETLARVG